MSLESHYGRPVPANVVLSDDFDGSADTLSKAGDTVEVVAPPLNVTVDDSSLFVLLSVRIPGGSVAKRLDRLYNHEFKAANGN